jgi:hypothetical protein
MSRSLLQWAAAGSFAGLLAACTAVRDGRRTLDWLDANLTPSSPAARGVLLPVAIPVGVVGLLTDVLLVNPVLAIDDAWGDTTDLLWTSQEESTLRRVLFTPLAAVATPFVFAGDWLGRSLLPLPPRREAP